MKEKSAIEYLLTSLSEEELKKVKAPSYEEIKASLDKGRQDVEKCFSALYAKKGYFS